MPEQKIVFTKGMDSDTTDELIQAGSQRFRLNVRALSAELAALGAIEDVLGNTLVTYSLPSGANTCIGSYEDLRSNKVYFFVYNASSNHSVLEYSVSGNSIQQVVAGAFLNFDINHLITGINVVELDNDTRMLYWTDNFNEPKKINIQKGIYWSQGNYTLGYPLATFNPEWIMRIKQPPLVQPTASYQDDPTVNVNHLIGKLFQFKEQYIYDDFEHSATGPISVTPYPIARSVTFTTTTTNNLIVVTVPTGNELVTRIKIFARILNIGDFFEILDVNKKDSNIADNSIYNFNFYNDKIYTYIDVNESDKLFDFVPLKSQSQDIIKGERIVDGLITEGYDPVSVDAKIDLDINTSFAKNLFSIYGNLYIKAPLSNSYPKAQPIFIDSTGLPAFGGFTTNHIITGVSTLYKQALPLGGFVVYLAGTNFYGISKQIITTSVGSDQNQVNGVYLNNGNTLNHIGHAYQTGQLFSQFAINNVPPGEYIMRIAANSTLTTDLASGNLDWQNLSTNVLSVAGVTGTECRLTVDQSGNVTIGSNVYPNGVLDPLTATTNVADLLNPVQTALIKTSRTTAISGYLTDDDIGGGLTDTRIELGSVQISNPSYSIAYTEPIWASQVSTWSTGRTYTDHNGYFFYAQNININLPAPDISGAFVAGTNIAISKSSYPSGLWVSPAYIGGLFEGVFSNTVANSLNSVRTIVTGTILYQNSGVPGYTATLSHGRITVSATANGVYSGYAYPNSRDFDTYGVSKRNDTLVFGSGASSIASFSIVDFPVNISIGPLDYNTTTIFTVPTIAVTNIVGNGLITSEKRGSIVQYGLVYYDHGNRSGLTNTNDYIYNVINPATNKYGMKLKIPFYTELQPNGQVYGGGYPIISWGIYSTPPAWATHYQWVKFRPVKRYLQFATNNVVYMDIVGNNVGRNSPNCVTISLNMSNIITFNTQNSSSTIVYTYADGDRVRFIKNPLSAAYYPGYYDIKINGVTAAGEIRCDFSASIPPINNGDIIEIWNPSPKTDVVDQIYYEFGECYNVVPDQNGILVHAGPTQNQKVWNFSDNFFYGGDTGFTSSGTHNFVVGDKIKINQLPGFTYASYNTYATVTFVQDSFNIVTDIPWAGNSGLNPGTAIGAAIGAFSTGDTFYRQRIMPFLVGLTGTPQNQLATSPLASWIEDANLSDFYVSNSVDIGRPNRYDPDYKQVTRPATVYYSEKLIPETKINGLSSVFDTNFESYERIHGGIYKFHSDDQVLYMFQELKCGHIPIDQLIYNSPPSGQQVVGASDNVLSPQAVYYEAQYGIGKNPESFSTYGGARYGIDVKRGVAWRLSRNGLTPISTTNQQKVYFMNTCRSIVNSGQKVNIYGVFDIKFGEYIASIQPYLNVPGDTIAFNEDANGWSTHYSYLPENMCTAGINMISFKNGQVWLHNQGPLYNNFYGVQYDTQIWVTCNDFPSNKKILQAISLECSKGWNATVVTPNGQASDLQVSDFQMKEGYMYAAFGHDTNTPNVTDPWINGDPIRDNTFLIKLSYPGNNYVKIFAVNLLFQDSPRSNR